MNTAARPASLRVRIGQHSLAGRRARNEDFLGATQPEGAELDSKGMVLVVADGVGGHANGREAAEYAVRNLLVDYYATPDTWSVAKSLETVLVASNRWLLGQARHTADYIGMATTLSGLVLRGARYYLAHVGDSRIYLLRDGALTQLTEDHTWPHPELENVLRRAIGLDAHLVVDHGDGELQVGDRFILLTDGVWGTLGDAGIQELLARHGEAEDAAEALTREALRRDSQDNCSALVADVAAVPQGDLRDTLLASSKLPLPPRLAAGQEIDGLRVRALLHESRETLLYQVERHGVEGPQLLVLKTLRPECGDEEAVAALVYEEWLARRAIAPCFPQVISHGPRAHLYYLMTWHEGESLKARLARGHQFTPAEAAQLGIRLLSGIGRLHRLGIIHRDIKPDNLQLGPDGRLTILDLGVAASDGHRFREINNPGTPSYMAPELFAGQAASESSDLYACGVTLYELLTRRYPYGEIEPFQLPRFGQPVPPTRYRRDIPDWLENILLKACARDVAERFETAEEFRLALERGAHRPLAVRRRVPLVERRPGLVLKVVAGLSLLFNLVLLYLWSRH
ncbi:serine/threonine protein phosphatase [Denitratisoma sp. DHT3]|uniref:bifunctional protein-serine/threonine kinase/phosphatase n=1 Tax=Denitratisoma sp. DHT3 TaxID=1981880 RepID=UPI0011987B95|nr:bifunctional protein-serine/threonine kinase/phosphatase [Denitratisoma sp. DHT3]QDX80015.1 serine/threonine protein phosphatase [Denitratisoma sp. DHT3]